MTNSKKKIKVLQIAGGFRKNIDGKAVSGGVPSFLFNYYSKMNRENIQFDFLAIRNQCFEPYQEQLENFGSKVDALNIQEDGFKRFFKTIDKLSKYIKENSYDAVHINMGSFFPVLTCAIAAKKAGVKNIISHSHSVGYVSKKKRLLINLFSPLLSIYADQYLTCSIPAGKNLYSEKIQNSNQYKIIRNAIDVNRFSYNPSIRSEIRRELNIENEFVIGHVGRFVEVKNHEFLLNLFREILSLNENSTLLLIGEGELKNSIMEKAKEMKIYQKIKFLGQQRNVQDYYQAMDVFVLPSFVEGFPIVTLESQTAGLPTFVAKNITNETNVTELFKSFSLEDNIKELAIKIIDCKSQDIYRKDFSKNVAKAGFNLEENISIFESLYV